MKRKIKPLSKCDVCHKKTYVITITRDHEKLCDECFKKQKINKN